MSESTSKMMEWADKVQKSEAISWDRLPEIYLYMDQVITFMNKQLDLYERDDSTTLLTSSMINNYVKDGVLERPCQKKYSKEHLAMLTVICMLKQVLSIQDISALLKSSREKAGYTEIYESFCAAQTTAIREICARVSDAAQDGEDELRNLALRLSIEASARRTAAERILSGLSGSGK